jgi:hypothetical protein
MDDAVRPVQLFAQVRGGTVELEGVVGVGLLASANADPTTRLIPATNTQIRKPMIVMASQTRLCADRSSGSGIAKVALKTTRHRRAH